MVGFFFFFATGEKCKKWNCVLYNVCVIIFGLLWEFPCCVCVVCRLSLWIKCGFNGRKRSFWMCVRSWQFVVVRRDMTLYGWRGIQFGHDPVRLTEYWILTWPCAIDGVLNSDMTLYDWRSIKLWHDLVRLTGYSILIMTLYSWQSIKFWHDPVPLTEYWILTWPCTVDGY